MFQPLPSPSACATCAPSAATASSPSSRWPRSSASLLGRDGADHHHGGDERLPARDPRPHAADGRARDRRAASANRWQDWPQAVAIASGDKRVAGAAPYVETEALLPGARSQPALVRGVLPERRGQGLRARPTRWSRASSTTLEPGSFNIVLGQRTGAVAGRRRRRQRDRDIVRLPQHADRRRCRERKRFNVSGIFEAGYNEYDNGLAVVNMQDRSACCAWARASPACA